MGEDSLGRGSGRCQGWVAPEGHVEKSLRFQFTRKKWVSSSEQVRVLVSSVEYSTCEPVTPYTIINN